MQLLLDSGIEIVVKEISNSSIYEAVSKSTELIVPQPPEVELDDGTKIVNTFSETYHNAIAIFEMQKNNYAFDMLLDLAIDFDESHLNRIEWKNFLRNTRHNRYIKIPENKKIAFLKFYAVKSFTDKHLITRNALLNEHDVFDIFNSISVTRDGNDLLQAAIRNSINTNIEIHSLTIEGFTIVNPIDESRACKDFGLSWIDWLNCRISNKEKASVVALHRLDRYINSHQDDAVQIESERKNKSKNKG